MSQFFNSLFNIRQNEWSRVLYLYFMGLIVVIGQTWGEATAESAFLNQVGLKGLGFLPVIFVLDAIITVFAIAVYTAFVDRVANDKLLITILAISAAAISTGLALILGSQLVLAYPLLYLLSRILREVFNLHWWTYVNGFYDTRAAKRITPFIATGGRFAGIFGGLLLLGLNQLATVPTIIGLWAASLVVAGTMIPLMPRIIKKDNAELERGPGGAGSPSSYVRNITEGFRYVRQSSFLLWMAVSAFLLAILLNFILYQNSQIFIDRLVSQKDISNFVAFVSVISNLIMLPIQLFFLSRIVARMGLGNANLIFPVGSVGVAALLLAPVHIVIGGIVYVYRTTFRTSFRNTLDNLLYNAVPLSVKGRARAFIGGLIVPLGSLCGGLVLIALPDSIRNTLSPLPLLSIPILIVSILYLASTVVIRRQYSQALIKMLEQEDFSFLLGESSDLTAIDTATLNWLKHKIDESASSDTKIFLAKLLSEVGGNDSVPILAELARSGDGQVRASITDMLVAADVRSDAVRGLLTEFLYDPDGRVRQAAIAGLRQLADPNSEEFLALAYELSHDPEMDVRIQILPTLIKSRDFFYLASAMQTLTPILASTDGRWRARGVEILGQATDVRFIRNLCDYINDADEEVRLEAALAVEGLSQQTIPKAIADLLLSRVIYLLRDPVERTRRAALTILGRIDNPEARQILIGFLTDPSPEIRSATVEAMVRIGKPIIPFLLPTIDKITEEDQLLRKMVTVVLARIDQERSGDLIRNYVESNLVTIYANITRISELRHCRQFRSIAILRAVLTERNLQLSEECFYLLSAIYDPKTVKVVQESLASDSARSRANALEAVESLVSPQMAKLVGPLFDRDMPKEQLIRLAKDISGSQTGTKEVIREILMMPGDPWLRAIMNYGLGEMAAAAFGPKEQPSLLQAAFDKASELKASDFAAAPGAEAKETKKEQGRKTRRSGADLLGKLTDEGQAKVPEPEKPTPPAESPPPDTGEESKASRSRFGLGALLGEGSQAKSPGRVAAEPKRAETPCEALFSKDEIETLFNASAADPVQDIQLAVLAARRMLAGMSLSEIIQAQEGVMLSTIEKIIFLKEVPFFEGMTVDQLKILASVCEEELFNEDKLIFNEGDPGGALYVVVRGRVALEREGQRKGSSLRIATIEAYSYFGEMTLFDNSPRTEKALAIKDTLTLRLRREPLIALTRQYPDLSLKLINVLSQRLREANDRIAQLTTVKPRELHKLYDKLE